MSGGRAENAHEEHQGDGEGNGNLSAAARGGVGKYCAIGQIHQDTVVLLGRIGDRSTV